MKPIFNRLTVPQFIFSCCMGILLQLAPCFPLFAQQPSSNSTDIQHEAMQKLSFLAGRWTGPITVVRGPRGSVHLTQTEDIQYKLVGLCWS